MNISSFESEFNKIMRRDYFTSYVKPIREQAFNNFLEKGLPNKNWEDWRHTDLKPIKEIDFRLSEIGKFKYGIYKTGISLTWKIAL